MLLKESRGAAKGGSNDGEQVVAGDGASGLAAEPASGRGRVRRLASRMLGWQETAPGVALTVLVLFVGLTHSAFFSNQALVGNIRAASFVAIIAFGMVFLLAMGEIDISVGGSYGICFFVCAELGSHGTNMYVAAVVAILAGAGLGLANGILVTLLRAPALIVTLGTYSLYAGLVSVISGGLPIGADLPLKSSFFTGLGGNWLSIPVAGWFALALMIVLTVVLTKSRFGAMVRAVGSNRSAAAFSGIPDTRLRIYCLMLTGTLAGLAGVLTLAYAQGGDSTIGSGFELQAIAAAIIGGTAITGGTGSVPGGLIGALLVATINSALVFFNVNQTWDDVVTGIVILIAVGSGALLTHWRAYRPTRVDA